MASLRSGVVPGDGDIPALRPARAQGRAGAGQEAADQGGQRERQEVRGARRGQGAAGVAAAAGAHRHQDPPQDARERQGRRRWRWRWEAASGGAEDGGGRAAGAPQEATLCRLFVLGTAKCRLCSALCCWTEAGISFSTDDFRQQNALGLTEKCLWGRGRSEAAQRSEPGAAALRCPLRPQPALRWRRLTCRCSSLWGARRPSRRGRGWVGAGGGTDDQRTEAGAWRGVLGG